MNSHIKTKNNLRSKNKNKNDVDMDMDESLTAPDGGYAWIVSLACGFNILAMFPCYQYYGIIYQKRLLTLDLSKFEIATIFNIHISITAICGVFTIPILKRYSPRKIAFAGGFLATLGIFLSSFSNSFAIFLVTYSLLYGVGKGLCATAVVVVSNTYFKKKRMQAAGYQWSITAAGQVLTPYIVNSLEDYYGFQGMVWIFSGIALQSCVCAAIYQPVKWHMKKVSVKKQEEINTIDKQIANQLDPCSRYQKKNGSYNQAFVVDLKDKATITVIKNQPLNTNDEDKNSILSTKFHTFPGAFKTEIQKLHKIQSESDITSYKNENNAICLRTQQKIEKSNEGMRLKWYNNKKIVEMFGLELLVDPVFVMLLLGINLASFSEQNFMGLTPFTLVDFGYNDSEISLILVIMGVADVIFRVIVPCILQYLKWSAEFSFIVSILILVVGRITFSFNPSFYVTIVVFFIMGTARSLHVLYYVQILPMYVPIEKLPSAAGLQYLGTGLFAAILGPLTGKLQNIISYAAMINVLNLMSMVTGITWSIHLIYVKYKNKT